MPGRLQWDIFCKVIDNFGDIGVCWRLSADLADRGHRVRLWLDDASALQWMAPGGWAGVQVLQWADPLDLSPADLQAQPCNVLVEAFGCAVATEFIAAYARSDWSASQKPVWINLEYLSAEAYAGRSHALPSPVAYGPGAGATKWFFYPGFTSETGGLLRELSLSGQQDAFDADAWLARFGGAREDAKPERHISLFCYEPPLLRALLEQLAAGGLHGAPVRLMVTAGRASAAVRGILKTDRELLELTRARGLLSLTHLEPLSQIDFDRLLWACAVNFVRGEDSLVRSLWAGRPFVWQAYPQTDDTHLGKVEAFLAMLEAPVSMRNFYRSWNGAVDTLPMLDAENWRNCVANAKASLLGQLDLTSQLLSFVAGKQAEHPTP